MLSWQWPRHSSMESHSALTSTATCSTSKSSSTAVALAGWSDGCIDIVPITVPSTHGTATTTAITAGQYEALRSALFCCVQKYTKADRCAVVS
jgi:hypothetical protein